VNPAYSTYLKFLPSINNAPASANLEPLNNYLDPAEPYNWFYEAFANRYDYALVGEASLLRTLVLVEVSRESPGLDLCHLPWP